MRRKILISTTLSIVLLGSIWFTSTVVQSRAANPPKPMLSTNWVGYLAVGQDETMDQIGRGPYPTAKSEVQIGLRSDGVVVWRPTPGKNFSTIIVPQRSASPNNPSK